MLYADLRRQIVQCRQRFGGERTASLLQGWIIPHLRPADDIDVRKLLDEGEEIVTPAGELMSEIVDANPNGMIYLRNVRRDETVSPVERNFWEMPAHLIRNPWVPPSPALPWLLSSLLENDAGAAAVGREIAAADVAPPPQARPTEQPVDPEAIERKRKCLARLETQRAALVGEGAVNFERLVKDLYGLRTMLTTSEIGFVSSLLRRAYDETCFAPTARQSEWLIKIARRMLNGARA